MNVIGNFAPFFEKYLTLDRVHPTKTYNYKARNLFGLPVIEAQIHRPKCRIGESWMYVAIPTDAELSNLKTGEKLYVGAQTQDRMFRGDGGIGGKNYHHWEMRKGNGSDNPVAFLQSGRKICIHRISAQAISRAIVGNPELTAMLPLLSQPKTSKRHVGWWFEQLVLHLELDQWRWNSAPADRHAQMFFAEVLVGQVREATCLQAGNIH